MLVKDGQIRSESLREYIFVVDCLSPEQKGANVPYKKGTSLQQNDEVKLEGDSQMCTVTVSLSDTCMYTHRERASERERERERERESVCDCWYSQRQLSGRKIADLRLPIFSTAVVQ